MQPAARYCIIVLIVHRRFAAGCAGSESLQLGQGLQLVADPRGPAWADMDGRPEGLMAAECNLDFVRTRRQAEPLEDPVELVDDPGVRPVHEDLSPLLSGSHLDPEGSVIDAGRFSPISLLGVGVPTGALSMASQGGPLVGRGLPDVAGVVRLQRERKLVGSTATDEDQAAEGPIAVDGNLDLVTSRRQPETLEDPVEVVDHANVRPVYKDFRFLTELALLQLDPDGSAVAAGAIVAVAPETVSEAMPVAMPVPMPETVSEAMPVAVSEVVRIGLGRK